MRPALVSATGILGVLTIVEIAAVVVRRIATETTPGERYVRILGHGQDDGGVFLDFDAESFASHPGPLSLSAPTTSNAAGQTLDLEVGQPTDSTVRRYVKAGDVEPLVSAGEGRCSGHLGKTPASFALEYSSVTIGNFPAWIVPGRESGRSDVWAIHIHGLGSSRSQVLRGLPLFNNSGLTSLVPSYETSLDNEGAARTSNLGTTEWKSIAAAQEYAMSQGARQIIYVGWSLGASLALRAAAASPGPVAGAVLVSPALDWKNVILHGMTHRGLPGWLAKAVLRRFNHIHLGNRPAIRWKEMPGHPESQMPAIPLLILHGMADRTVPIEHSRQLAAHHRGETDLVEFEFASHTLEWNADRSLWERSVGGWLASRRGNDHDNAATMGGNRSAE